MQRKFMFPPMLVSAAFTGIILYIGTDNAWSVYDFIFTFSLMIMVMSLVVVRMKTEDEYRCVGSTWWGLMLPTFLGAVFILQPLSALVGAIMLTLVVILRDWWVYDTTPQQGLSMSVRDGKIVWKSYEGTPRDRRRARRARRSQSS